MKRATPLLILALASPALAHDAWVQTNAHVVRAGDYAQIDLMLGNHGNEHRDFKLAGKLSLEGTDVSITGPSGAAYDLKPVLIDIGYAPQEGFWTARFDTAEAGLYRVALRSDRVMTYAPERSIKSAKSFFVASRSLDAVPVQNPGFDVPAGHELELVPVSNPVTPMGPGTEIRVRLLYKDKPLTGERVSFIPRGTTLAKGFDETYERTTDSNGEAAFEPREGNIYLLAAHKTEQAEGGTLDGQPYQFTKYGATLTVLVPRICPCCAE